MSRIKQAVILAGGLGTRLLPLTNKLPKPMVRINGKPFLHYVISNLVENEIEDIVILTGYLESKIVDFFKSGKKYGVRIVYSFSPVTANTGERLRAARSLLHGNFLLLYGDNYWPLQLDELETLLFKQKTISSTCVFSNFDRSTRNNTLVANGKVIKYDKARKDKNLNGVNIGYFILNKEIINNLKGENPVFEDAVIDKLVQKNELLAHFTNHKYYSLTDKSRIPSITSYFRRKKVIFLDRDGVINVKPPKGSYVTSLEKFVLKKTTISSLKILRDKGYSFYVVSNQPGIAKGLVSREDVDSINKEMVRKLAKEGIEIIDYEVCPHGWEDLCSCRKPMPGMFFTLAAKHHINLYEACCIGDDPRDIVAGSLAGCKTYIINDKNPLSYLSQHIL